jgi:hypothetical protein
MLDCVAIPASALLTLLTFRLNSAPFILNATQHLKRAPVCTAGNSSTPAEVEVHEFL